MAQLNINVPDAQYQAFKAAATRSGRSMREIVLAAIADHIVRGHNTSTTTATAPVTRKAVKVEKKKARPELRVAPRPMPVGIPKSYSTR